MPDFQANSSGILVPRRFSKAKYTTEIATAHNDITYPLYGGLFSAGNNRLIPRDETLRTKGSADSYKIYDDILKDPHCYAVLQKRYMEVVGREWVVSPASEKRKDRKAALLVENQLKNLAKNRTSGELKFATASGSGGFNAVCMGLLTAIAKGFSVGEVLWGKNETEVYPKEIRVKDQRRFAFSYTGENVYSLNLLTPGNQWTGEPLPPRKFIAHTFHGEYDNPLGYGLGEKLFWPVWFKKNGIKFWLAFADKFGSPTGLGKYPSEHPRAEEIRDKLLQALNAIAQEAGVAIPEETTLEFLEANRQSTTNTYQELAEFMNSEMSKAVLGETGSTDQSGEGGSRARDEVGNNVRISIAKLDADLLADTLNATLIRWITDFNFAAGSVGYPTLSWKFPELEEKENLDTRVNRDSSLQELGWRLTPEKVEEVYGDGYVPLSGQEEESPPLVSTLGVGGTQALLGFLQQGASAVPRDNAIATLTTVFGIPEEQALQIVPEASEEPGEAIPSSEDELASIFGGGGEDEPPLESEAEVEQTDEAEFAEGSCSVPGDRASDGSLCGGRARNSGSQGKASLEGEFDSFIAKAKEDAAAFDKFVKEEDRTDLDSRVENAISQSLPDIADRLKAKVLESFDAISDSSDASKLEDDWTPDNISDLLTDQFQDVSSSVVKDILAKGDFEDLEVKDPEGFFSSGIFESVLPIINQTQDALEKHAEERVEKLFEEEDIDLAEERDRPKDIPILYTEQATESASPEVNKWVAQINSIVQQVNDSEFGDAVKFANLQEQLYELYGEMDAAGYADVLGDAIASADLAGRYEVVQEVPSDELEFAEKYAHINFVPPKGVRDAAARGLELRKKHGRGGLTNKEASKEGIGSGVQRATNLKNGDRVSPKVIKQMAAFFSRHEKNKDSTKPDGSPGAGKIAWLLWGGNPGKAWANKIKRQIESADLSELSFNEWVEFQSEVSTKTRNCNPVRSFPCGRSCQTLKPRKDGTPRQCRKRLEGQAKDAAEWLKMQAEKRTGDSGAEPESKNSKPKPFMTEDEAIEFTKDSAWKDQVFYHGTSSAGADAITSDGIDISKNLAAVYGQGFYMGGGEFGKETAENYAFKKGDPTILTMRVNVQNPRAATSRELMDELGKALASGELVAPKFGKGVSQEEFDQERSRYNSDAQKFFLREGFDAIHVTDLDYFIASSPDQIAVYGKQAIDDNDNDLLDDF